MSVTVTLHLFSGRPNPKWKLSAKQAKEFADRVARIDALTAQKPHGVLGMLGYRGFTVETGVTPKAPATATFVHGGVVDPGQIEANLVDGDRQVEAWLLTTAGTALDDEIVAHVRGSIAERPKLTKILPKPLPKCLPCVAVDAPAYTPGTWNVPAVQPFNNCYNYANNKVTNTFAQPGRAHGAMYTQLNCANVRTAATADGLVSCPNFTTPRPAKKGWYVALVIWPNVDYHWYRQDKSGCWSHKPGSTAARNVDNSGHSIRDPKTCDRGPYTSFCTYMVTRKGVVIN